jgi:hypothetical protein
MYYGVLEDLQQGYDAPPLLTHARNRWRICRAFRPGDGTVPDVSGAAPKNARNVRVATSHRDLAVVRAHIKEKRDAKVKSYGHQDICNDLSVQWNSCHSIVEIIAKSEEVFHATIKGN